MAIFVLAFLSGTFSSSETALFKLGEGDLARAPKRVKRLLEDPRALLVSILLANLVVNLLFFAIAPRAFTQLQGQLGIGEPLAAQGGASLFGGLLALITLLLTGEIVPKALALRMPLGIARVTATPIGWTIRFLRPVRYVVGFVLELSHRVLGENERTEQGVTPEALADVLERSRTAGVLGANEADLLGEIVELEHLRVREAMTPRVDLVIFDLEAEDQDGERRRVLDESRRERVTWMIAVRGSADNIAGGIQVRDLLVKPDRSPESLVMPVKFVPEVARLVSLLSSFHIDRVTEAVVVDEWGGTAGVVTLEAVFEELVGDIRVEDEEAIDEVVPLGEGRYRVSGGLSVRDWNETLGVAIFPGAFETVGGFVTAALGRLPKAGDTVELGGGLVAEIDQVRGRRVFTVTLWSRAQGRTFMLPSRRSGAGVS
ncbi:hemolysin family protein [Saltatorellus ferox]|uniref:hemolysin family protein n=1 Tax=Saltatorellus ferox TaxID=2528018 RepID=UPI003AF3D290